MGNLNREKLLRGFDFLAIKLDKVKEFFMVTESCNGFLSG